MKRILVFLIALFGACVFTSCNKEGYEGTGDFVAFTTEPNIAYIAVGETCEIKVYGVYSNNTKKDITSKCDFSIYESAVERDPVISLEKNKVTALKAGPTIVVVEYENDVVVMLSVKVSEK